MKLKPKLKPKQIEEIFERFNANKPNPQIELDYYSPYTLLVAVILSAQATDKGVNRVTPNLFAIADTPQKMVELGEEKLKQIIKSIGLYNSKSKNIILMSKALIEKHDGEVPSLRCDLEALSGVGRKTANIILSVVHGLDTIAVDTHVFRVANRVGICKASNPLKTELELIKVVPDKWKRQAHFWLVLHGRYVCKARRPECYKCIINDICRYPNKLREK